MATTWRGLALRTGTAVLVTGGLLVGGALKASASPPDLGTRPETRSEAATAWCASRVSELAGILREHALDAQAAHTLAEIEWRGCRGL